MKKFYTQVTRDIYVRESPIREYYLLGNHYVSNEDVS